MFPLIPLPEFLPGMAQLHEMAAWLTFIAAGGVGAVLTVVTTINYSAYGNRRDKVNLRVYVGLTAYGILALVGGLYVVSPFVALTVITILYYLGKGVLIVLFPKKF